MAKEMLINVSQGEECRIALLEEGRLEELYMERTSATSHVGNIYKGHVTNVEPSIQAAFIDFGGSRNGFLHISDLMPSYFGGDGADVTESVGRKISRRDRPPIQRCLRRGDEIIVQIIKEGIGTKGPTLTTYLSIPGRILVMMPGMAQMGVSRKIEDDEERRRLRGILDSLKPPKDVGFIIRTNGVGKAKTEIQRDLTYLTRLWTIFVKKRDSGPGPTELYTEGDLVTRSVRDVFTTDVDSVIVDDKEVAKRVKEVIKLANPRTKNKVDFYDGPVPLFHKFGIEREIELMYSRHVPLPSGGSLVIDSTEAIVAIDVNSGKFRDHSDAETTAFKTDMEAADEIPRQLKLRDLGGVIICDFIDLRYERHRRELEERLHENFSRDRAKTKVLRMSQFGIIELTRQRRGPSLKRSIYFDCPHCKGAGLVKTPESMSLDVMRRLAIAGHDERVARVELTVCPDVNYYLQNRNREQIAELEKETGKRIMIRGDTQVAMDDVKFDLFDARDSAIYIQELGMAPPQAPVHGGRGQRPQGRGGRDQGRNRQGGGRDFRRQQQQQRHEQRPRDEEEDEPREPEVDREEREEPQNDQPQPVESAEHDDGPQPGNDRSGPDPNYPRKRDDLGGEQGQKRRRRGRRGGRNRNRNRDNDRDRNFQQPQEQSVGENIDELEVDRGEEEDNRPPQQRPVRRPPPRPDRDYQRSQEPTQGGGRDDQAREDEAHDQPVESEDQPEGSSEGGQPVEGDEPRPARKRRRGRRGGRGRRRSKDAPAEVSAKKPDDAPRAAEAESHTPTGSADRHLGDDEPIAPPPSSRPRSYRDLDSIPDDYD